MTGYYSYITGQRLELMSRTRISPAARARILGEPVYAADAAKKAYAAKAPRERRETVTIQHVRKRGLNGWREPEPKHARNRIADVLKVSAEVFGVTVDEMTTPDRSRKFAYPRFAATHILHKVLRLSLPTIGKTFKRDHTTCLWAIRRAAILRRKDPAFAGRSRLLAAELRRLWRVQ